MNKTPSESNLNVRTPDSYDGCLVIQVSGSKTWDFLAVSQFLQKMSTQFLVLGHNIFLPFLLIFLQFKFRFSKKIGVWLKMCNEYKACPTNRAPIQRPTPTGLCYRLQHWSRDRFMCPHTPDCVKHKMGFNIALEFCILCCGHIMKSLSVRHVDKTITKY